MPAPDDRSSGPPGSDLVVSIQRLTKVFHRASGARVRAVDDVSLDVHRGEMVAILGPSGCGKTTLMRCVAGLEDPTEGEIRTPKGLLSSGAKGSVVPPERRNFGMMFQSYAVWPHMTVFDNVAYPLRIRRRPKEEIAKRVGDTLTSMGIGHLAKSYSAELSGGQQQRVALARCLVMDPDLILFDEPLSNVDAKVREELRVELLALQHRIGFAGLYVTHDQEEAMAIANRVIVMNEGRVLQVGPGRQVYENPNSRFVASFVGTINEFLGVLGETPAVGSSASGEVVVRTPVGDLRVADRNVGAGLVAGSPVAVIARPEALGISADDGTGDTSRRNVLHGEVEATMFRGPFIDYVVRVAAERIRVRTLQTVEVLDGQRVAIWVSPEKLRVLPVDDTTANDDA